MSNGMKHLCATLAMGAVLSSCVRATPPLPAMPATIADIPSPSSAAPTRSPVPPTYEPPHVTTGGTVLPSSVVVLEDLQRNAFALLFPGTTSPPTWNAIPPDCISGTLPWRPWLLCGSDKDNAELFYIVDGSRTQLPFGFDKVVGVSSDGSMILFSKVEEDGTLLYSAFDYCNGTSWNLFSGSSRALEERWLTHPSLAADGFTLAVITDLPGKMTAAPALLEPGPSVRGLTQGSPPATWDLAWSPVGMNLAYGATDIEQEVAPMPNLIYVVDTDTDRSRLLVRANSDVGFFTSRSIQWSPTGDDLSVGNGDEACILDVETSQQRCFRAIAAENGAMVAWDPSGRRLAHVDETRQLIVTDSEGDGPVVLVNDVPGAFRTDWVETAVCPEVPG